MVQSYSFNIHSHFIFLSSLLVNLGQSVILGCWGVDHTKFW